VVTGVVRMDYAAAAMDYVRAMKNRGVNVAAINCSWGSSNSGGISAAADNLLAADVMIIVAAGNSNSSIAPFLNSKAGTLSVAATDRDGAAASFTNYGTWVDIAAPGVDIVSTYHDPADPDPTHMYVALLSETSMSAPHCCGVAALLESKNPALTGPQKYRLMQSTATPYSGPKYIGTGIVIANNAVGAAGP
jgi:subtilisin family serine protease